MMLRTLFTITLLFLTVTPLLCDDEKISCEQMCERDFISDEPKRLECQGKCQCRAKCEQDDPGDAKCIEKCDSTATPAIPDIHDLRTKEG